MKPVAAVLRECPTIDAPCCLSDATCLQRSGGRCIPQAGNPCGGAVPVGNTCSYAACVTDNDCVATRPVGATVSACVPSGAFGLPNATCIHGGCRTDADCTVRPGGRCAYGDAATHNGMCDLRQVFFCAYPSDPCMGATGCTFPQICLPEETYQGRHCAIGPPRYP